MRSGGWRKAYLVLIRRVIQLPSSAIFFNFHQVQFTNDIRCNILQRFNGKCRKPSCKNFRAFPKHATFTPRYGQLVLGNTLKLCHLTIRVIAKTTKTGMMALCVKGTSFEIRSLTTCTYPDQPARKIRFCLVYIPILVSVFRKKNVIYSYVITLTLVMSSVKGLSMFL